jgi:hypothetical protein
MQTRTHDRWSAGRGPIFGGGGLRESILETAHGLKCIRKLCEAEASLFDQGIIATNHLVIVAKPRPLHPRG